MTRENASLKDQLQRALTELRGYQLKYPSVHGKGEPLPVEDLPPWTTAEEIVNPLFDAYDNRIAELEKIVETQSTQLEAFHEKVTSIMDENEKLRNAQLENLKLKDGKPSTFGSLTDDLYAEMSERIEILMSENALMVEQKALLSNELEAHQEELTLRTKEVAELNQMLNSNLKDLKTCKEHIAQVEAERDEASEKALSYSAAVAKMEASVDQMKGEVAQAQVRAAALERDLKEARATSKALTGRLDNEAQASMRRMKTAEDRIMELHSQLLQRTEEVESCQDIIRKLRREYQSTRQDAEGMLQVMQGLERQVAAFADREKDVERMAAESRVKVEEALISRDQAVCREKQSMLEVEKLLTERKAIIQEKHNQIQQAVEEARIRCATKVAAAEEAMQKMASQNAELRLQSENSSREERATKELLDRMQRFVDEERRKVEDAIESLRKELASASRNVELETAKRVRVQSENTEHRLTIDKLRVQVDECCTFHRT